jgi:hypothetical protein
MKKTFKTYIGMFVGILFFISSFLQIDPLTETASNYSKEIAKSAAVTYAALRGINAALSFVEEVEVEVSTVVASTSVQPFKLLEPLDDAVERLSSTIFYVGVSAGIISIALGILGKASLAIIGVSIMTFEALRFSGASGYYISSIKSFLSNGLQTGSTVILLITSFAISSLIIDQVSIAKWSEYDALVKETFESLPSQESEIVLQSDLQTSEKIITTPKKDTSANKTFEISSENPNSNKTQGVFKKITGTVESFTGVVIESTSNKFKSISTGIGNASTNTKEFISSTRNRLDKKRKIARTVFNNLMSNSNELIEAFSGIFVAYIFKVLVLPIIIFTLLLGIVRNSFRFNRN